MNNQPDLQLHQEENTNDDQIELTNKSDQQKKKIIIITIAAIVVILTLVVLATIFLLDKDNTAMTEQIRDVFIIFMALESLIIGAALVVLIIQLATLINLLQNEIRPIIDSTNETVNTLKGTALFLSDNLAEPVIKMNSFAAKFRRLFKTIKK
jgi:hypothetical protein